jgi:hypothetical protein
MGNNPGPIDLEHARAVKAAHEDSLMALPDVVAVGVGLRNVGDPEGEVAAIIVSVARQVPTDLIPAAIDGVPIEVQLTGPLTAGAP